MNQPLQTPTVRERNRFDQAIEAATGTLLHASDRIQTLQINIGLICNLACHHCHVESTPKRTEQMDRETLEAVLVAAEKAQATTIDITGGAPEMNPHFRWFVAEARSRKHQVMVRTNLTIMLKEGYEDLPAFDAEHQVHLVASLPCYLESNVDKQRGKHVYQESIEVIRRLNDVGYGIAPHLPLDLVYNPGGPSLPPDQPSLEADYKKQLHERFGIRFSSLFTITNMPIGRFLHDLRRDGKATEYEQKLREAFNAATVEPLMCRHQVHVSHDGSVHDCDFNYALKMTCDHSVPQHIHDFDPEIFIGRRIATDDHCFGCTAGHGSSCGGALT